MLQIIAMKRTDYRMSFWGKISGFSQSAASSEVTKNLLEATNVGNALGSLLGVAIGAAIGIATGGIGTAILLGVGIGAACGVTGGALFGMFKKTSPAAQPDIAEPQAVAPSRTTAPALEPARSANVAAQPDAPAPEAASKGAAPAQRFANLVANQRQMSATSERSI
jgi:phage tail tape-measure protein